MRIGIGKNTITEGIGDCGKTPISKGKIKKRKNIKI